MDPEEYSAVCISKYLQWRHLEWRHRSIKDESHVHLRHGDDKNHITQCRISFKGPRGRRVWGKSLCGFFRRALMVHLKKKKKKKCKLNVFVWNASNAADTKLTRRRNEEMWSLLNPDWVHFRCTWATSVPLFVGFYWLRCCIITNVTRKKTYQTMRVPVLLRHSDRYWESRSQPSGKKKQKNKNLLRHFCLSV